MPGLSLCCSPRSWILGHSGRATAQSRCGGVRRTAGTKLGRYDNGVASVVQSVPYYDGSQRPNDSTGPGRGRPLPLSNYLGRAVWGGRRRPTSQLATIGLQFSTWLLPGGDDKEYRHRDQRKPSPKKNTESRATDEQKQSLALAGAVGKAARGARLRPPTGHTVRSASWRRRGCSAFAVAGGASEGAWAMWPPPHLWRAPSAAIVSVGGEKRGRSVKVLTLPARENLHRLFAVSFSAE